MQPHRTPGNTLPEPHPDSLEHSQRVAASLRAAIEAAGGSISFGEFMQHALYAPGLGYYVAGSRKFGADGDFVTAPEISPLFGQVLAGQCQQVLDSIADGDILEFGAGSGALCVQLMQRLAERDALPLRYQILEVSADLRERQQQCIRAELGRLADRVEWLDGLPQGFRGAVVANEVADALPVERFVIGANGVLQWRVGMADGDFCWQQAPAPAWLSAAVADIEKSIGRTLPPGYSSELSPGLAGWIGDIAGSLQDAFVFLLDYGVSRQEYYAPDRVEGWLRCYFRHHAHDDPLLYPGIQDLTAWVDFTAVAEAASAAGLEVAGYVSQSQFLLHGGLADELADFEQLDGVRQYELSRAVKLLTLPGEMGEHFKCLGLAAGTVALPAAVTAADRSHTL
jgi:SAM-dependent MidA family methyltransferase